jgi:hypothetical protein
MTVKSSVIVNPRQISSSGIASVKTAEQRFFSDIEDAQTKRLAHLKAVIERSNVPFVVFYDSCTRTRSWRRQKLRSLNVK